MIARVNTNTLSPLRASVAANDDARSAVYRAIKDLILSGALRPGNKLVHEDLAQTLGVSRTPVREALERLQQDGLIVHVPRRGCFVAEITAEEARELYGLRQALELHALRETAKIGLSPVDLRRLGDILARYAQLVRDNVMRERLQVDRDFHLALAAVAGNRALSSTLQAVYERIFLKIRTEGFRTPRGAEGYREHLAIFNALKKNDFTKAQDMLADHIEQGRNRLLKHIDDAAAAA